MNYLSVENLTKSFGDRLMFGDLTFGIEQGQKVAIVAKNGSGKTTLLNCLLEKEQYDSGRVVFRKGIRVAFMEQSDSLDESHTILEEVFSHDLPELKAVKAYNEAMKKNDEQGIMDSYELMSELNCWEIEAKVAQILSVLKLTDGDMLVAALSGGQKKRVALAKVLMADPDFLILDEPTNHLDLDMIEWLEEYLSKSNSTILMITHDRYFLEVVCDTIFEIDDKTLFQYDGNFSYYLEKKAERQSQQQATIDRAKNTFKHELEWIRKQPKARSTKSKSRVDAFDDVKAAAFAKVSRDELEIPIKMERLGSKIVECHKVFKSFGDKVILKDFNYHFNRRERLGIVGNNGTGKSTLLNMMMDLEQPDKGKITVGETVVFGYYDQVMLDVDDDKKVIDVIRDIAEFIPLEKGKQMSAAQFLEKFLFPRDMHFNFVYKLSGGEKRRLKLMTILMANPNFLILDEPTNDLDIFTLSVLEEYLLGFEGCLIVVSHDRYFMDKMTDHLFVFEGEGVIQDIMGNYTIYRAKQQEQLKNDRKSDNVTKPQVVTPKTEVATDANQKRKLSFNEVKEYGSLEKELEKLEIEKSTHTEVLSSGTATNDQLMTSGSKLTEIMKNIEDKTERWMELAEFI